MKMTVNLDILLNQDFTHWNDYKEAYILNKRLIIINKDKSFSSPILPPLIDYEFQEHLKQLSSKKPNLEIKVVDPINYAVTYSTKLFYARINYWNKFKLDWMFKRLWIQKNENLKFIIISPIITVLIGLLFFFLNSNKEKQIRPINNIDSTKSNYVDSSQQQVKSKGEEKKSLERYREKTSKSKKTKDTLIINNGNVVISNNQTGGQTAHTINNFGPKKRSIKAVSTTLLEKLQQLPKATYRIHYFTGDRETQELTTEIDNILINAGWERIHPISYQKIGGTPPIFGVQMMVSKDTEPFQALGEYLQQALGSGFTATSHPGENVFTYRGWQAIELPEGRNGIVIHIGPNPEF